MKSKILSIFLVCALIIGAQNGFVYGDDAVSDGNRQVESGEDIVENDEDWKNKFDGQEDIVNIVISDDINIFSKIEVPTNISKINLSSTNNNTINVDIESGVLLKFTDGDIEINMNNITFNGMGKSSRLFEFENCEVVIDGNRSSEITKFTPKDLSGVIRSSNTILKIKNITFSENTSTAYGGEGGAVFFGNAPEQALIIDNVNFINNSSIDAGGALGIGDNGKAIIADSSFTNNHSIVGGALFSKDRSELETVNTKFIDNYVISGSGGAIESAKGTVLKISNSVFENNKTIDDDESWNLGGGAINISSGNINTYELIEISNSQFIENVSIRKESNCSLF